MNTQDSRQQWGTKAGFIFSAVGSAVGLGNIWRYPYVLYANGGGTFLVPYFIALFTAAIPLLILEYVVGSKYRGAPPLAMARINPRFESIGWLTTFVVGFIVLYYSAILSWVLNYFAISFDMGWGSDPAAFFFGEFLGLSDNPLNLGRVNTRILLGLGVIWLSAYLVCSRRIDKGIESINKILLPFMFCAMFGIVIRGVTLPGSAAGLNALFTTDWGMLLDVRVWLAAYGQVFFSLSVAMGVMITYSSYLPRKSELVNTAFIAGFANSAFEFTVAIGVFGILGYMSQAQGLPVGNVVADGLGLAFVAFPIGLNMMGAFGSITGVVFFACLAFAGFTSFISLLEAFNAPFIDKTGVSRKKMSAVSCIGGFALSIIFATGAGRYILDISDFFLNNFGLIAVGILEAVALCWVMDIGAFARAANENSYFKVGMWWRFSLKCVVPFVLSAMFIMMVYRTFVSGYGGYSVAALAVYGGTVIAACVILSFVMTGLGWRTPLGLSDMPEPDSAE